MTERGVLNHVTHMKVFVLLVVGLLLIPILCSIAVCPSGCANGGTCTRPRVCSCQSGWTGVTCSQRMLILISMVE